MAVSYEEALNTLQAMFPAPWTRDMLADVLQHANGLMENACDLVLEHGDNDPQVLVERLKACGSPQQQVAMDQELARSLAAANERHGRGGGRASGTNNQGGTGGYAAPTETHGQTDNDEEFARRLQDEIFAADGLTPAARSVRQRQSNRSATNAPVSATNSNSTAESGPSFFEGVGDVMQSMKEEFEDAKIGETLSSMGDGARRRFQMFKTGLESKVKGYEAVNTAGGTGGTSLLSDTNNDLILFDDDATPSATGASERRGLLDAEFARV